MIKMKQETLVKSKGRYAKKHYKREIIISSILYCLLSNKTNNNQK